MFFWLISRWPVCFLYFRMFVECMFASRRARRCRVVYSVVSCYERTEHCEQTTYT